MQCPRTSVFSLPSLVTLGRRDDGLGPDLPIEQTVSTRSSSLWQSGLLSTLSAQSRGSFRGVFSLPGCQRATARAVCSPVDAHAFVRVRLSTTLGQRADNLI